ncbi:MAG: DUF4214 domain-containing protein [Pseudomonadota bacterium]
MNPSTLAAPILLLGSDVSTPEKRDKFGVTGWTAPGASVDIVLDGAKLSTVTATDNGHYEYQLARWPATGHHDIVAVAHDAGGLTATSTVLKVDIGNQAPIAPTIGSAYYGSFYIHANGTVLYGETTPAATVRILANNEFFLATQANASGFWHIEAPSLADGAYRFRATATTNAGTTSGNASWSVRVDEHAPDAPLLMLGNGANNVNGWELAAFSGTTETGAQIALSIDGVVRGHTTASENGHWAIDLDLPAGQYQATARATDGALHVSAPSKTLAFSVSAPVNGGGDVAGDASTKAQLAVGASVQGVIEKTGDHDWYKVTLDTLTLYQFTLTAAESNAGTLGMWSSGVYEDYIQLWDPQGADGAVEVGQGTPTLQGKPKTILFAPKRAGDYFLDMGASDVTGSYTLSAVALARDDHANDIAHATALRLNGKLDGVINYAGDVDQFGLTLRAGVSYTVTLDSGGAAYGTVFRGLEQSGGPAARISGNGGRWEGVAALSLVPSEDGVYYVSATGGTGDAVPYHVVLTEVQDDYRAGIATTGRVLPDALAHGTLEVHADADWFKATLTAGQSYLLQALGAHGEELDLGLFDAAGKQLWFDSSTVYGTDSMLWRAPASGDYYFQVTSSFTLGAYTLLVAPAPADDFGASIASAGRLTPAIAVEGALETPRDADWLRVSLRAGSDYVFSLDTQQAGHTLLSTGQLQLLDGAGVTLAEADRGSPTYTAQLVFHATTTGDYYLAVSDPMQKHIGTYGVSMYGSSQDKVSADARTSATLSPGGLIVSNIDFATDTDWVRVDLKARHSYYFELTGTGGRGGTLPSSAMSLKMVDVHGDTVAYQTYLYGKDPTLGFYAGADVTYYVAVSASSSATGSYTLKESNEVTPYVDTLPPLLTSSILPVGTQVLERGMSMYVYFDEVVQLGGAAITLRLANGDLVESFSAAAGNASLPARFSSLTLTPKPLEYGTDYVLTLAPGSIADTSSHPFAGATLKFRTADAPPRQDGGAGNDVFHGRNGDEVIDGKGGRDSVIFTGTAAKYALSQADGALKVDALSGAKGHDTLVGIERVIFDDLAIAYDTAGNAGQAYRLYQATFNRAPDLNGLGYWIAQLDRGASLNTVADGFIHSTEFVARYGAANTDQDFIKALYSNVLHRLPDQAGADYWSGQLHGGASRAAVLTGFSESTENQAALIGQIAKGFTYHLYS